MEESHLPIITVVAIVFVVVVVVVGKCSHFD